MYGAYLRGGVDSLAHVVDGKGGHRNGRQRLHLHARCGMGARGSRDIHFPPLGYYLEVKINIGNWYWVAEGDQLGSSLTCHDSRYPSGRQRIALRETVGGESLQGGRAHVYAADRNSLTIGLLLASSVDHIALCPAGPTDVP